MGSLMVIGNGTIRRMARELVLTFHSNYDPILHRLMKNILSNRNVKVKKSTRLKHPWTEFDKRLHDEMKTFV